MIIIKSEGTIMENKRIPRYIHYCWFGGKTIPLQYEKYMKSWKEFCPDFEIMRWDESNFPIEDFMYAAEAYKENKMAFVSDVARIYALQKFGGIYLDTDVEIIKPLDTILRGHEAVLGWESIKANTMGTGFLAFVPKHIICERMIDYYKEHHFKLEDGTLNIKSNTRILAELIEKEYGLLPSTSVQSKSGIIIYPRRYFTAFSTVTKQSEITDDTYCIHHFAASWFSPWKKVKREVKMKINRILKIAGKQI